MDATTADKCPNDSQPASKAVRKFLDLSTGCLPHDEFKALEARAKGEESADDAVCIAVDHGYGLWVWVHPDDADLPALAEKFPHLACVMQVAREHGCAWINFDADAAAIEELPYWEW